MTPEIRQLTADDAEAYRDLRLEALREAPTAFGADHDEEAAQTLDWFAGRLRGSIVFAAEGGDGALAGMAGLYQPAERKAAHKGVLWGVYVRPSARGRSLAAALVVRVIEHARGRVTLLQAAVTVDNTAARALYRRLGFVPYGIEPHALRHDGRDHDEELLVLEFSQAPRPGPS